MFHPVYSDASRGLRLERDEHGVIHVEARHTSDLYWGLGHAHALDRGLQMSLMRILGYGRASELLDSSDETLDVDRFFRRMNWGAGLEEEKAALSADARVALDAYCEGAWSVLRKRFPWELRILGLRREPWRVEDSILLTRMVAYLTLAQSQAEVERLLVQIAQAGVSRDKLEELFPGALGGFDADLIRRVRLGDRIVPESVIWGGVAPRMMASNNWVVSGARSASGRPLLANDPHLEVNRLPAVWYETVLKIGDRYAMGATMPGIAGVLIGRTDRLAWGGTYSFMDAIDSWVEHCRDGKYRRGDDRWLPFQRRTETIRRKGKPSVDVAFFENDHGVLDGDPDVEGYYLSTHWSAARSGAASINAVIAMWGATGVDEGMHHLGAIESAFNWVLADRAGDIGYQMSGRMPVRREGHSGLVPLAGWVEANDWRGFVDPVDLPRCKNPERGFFVTANQDLNDYGKARPINASQGPHRARHIEELLAAIERATPEDCCRIQQDVTSAQASVFMDILRPLLPDSSNGRALAGWDLRYDLESRGAVLFEDFYRELRRIVFGPAGLGEQVVDFLSDESGIFADFFVNFDRVMLSERSAWFGERSREEIFREAAGRALARSDASIWRDRQQVMQRHILFGAKLPHFLGFDRGPLALPGGRSTILQGQIYRSAGRATSFAPSLRIVTDLGDDHCLTCLAGGPSDRRLSKWYCSEMEAWSAGRYKKLNP